MKSSFILWWIYVHAAPLLWTETERGNSSLKNAVKGIYVQTNNSAVSVLVTKTSYKTYRQAVFSYQQ